MANVFDQFDGNDGGGNAFDRFDAPAKPVRFMEEPTDVEKLLAGVQLPKWLENLRGTAPVRVLQGMADPMIGAMQTVANVLPDSTGIPQAVNKRVADLETDYEAQRKAMGSEGVDFARLAGNVVSPTNALIALKAPMAATAGARAVQGAVVGGGTAAVEPVTEDDGRFWSHKSGQVVGGVVAGAVLTPILGAVGDKAVRLIRDRAASRQAAINADDAIEAALKDMGQTITDVPPQQLQALRSQVQASLDSGRELNAAAALRKADFDALDMPAMRGQITRDPMEFAAERDLRGVRNVGEPITAVMETQGRKLQERIGANAEGARDAYNAGGGFIESLSGVDDKLRRHVSGLYGEARASAGKDLDVPLQGLAQDAFRIFKDYGNRAELGGVRNALDDLGVFTGKQTKTFTLEDANGLLQVINKNKSNDPAIISALGELRTAVKGAINAADASGGPFAPALKAAAERFKLHDAVPALKAAAEGNVAPDDFVRRFIVGGKTDEVKGLARVLQQADPASYNEARAQIGDVLKRAAFGENPAGDSPFSPTRYMAQIRKLGADKLGAFFNAEEVADILRLGRVGAYIHTVPNASAPNFSNSGKAVANLLRRVPGVPAVVDVGSRVAGAVNDGRTVRRALAAEVPQAPVQLSPRQRNWLRMFMAGGAAGAGTAAGQ
jgi:hypothetical protein